MGNIIQAKPTGGVIMSSGPSVKLGSGVTIDKKAYISMDKEARKTLDEKGIEGYKNLLVSRATEKATADYVKKHYVQLGDGQYIDKAAFGKLDTETQNILRERGVAGYEEVVKTSYETAIGGAAVVLDSGELVPESFYNSLPMEGKHALQTSVGTYLDWAKNESSKTFWDYYTNVSGSYYIKTETWNGLTEEQQNYIERELGSGRWAELLDKLPGNIKIQLPQKDPGYEIKFNGFDDWFNSLPDNIKNKIPDDWKLWKTDPEINKLLSSDDVIVKSGSGEAISYKEFKGLSAADKQKVLKGGLSSLGTQYQDLIVEFEKMHEQATSGQLPDGTVFASPDGMYEYMVLDGWQSSSSVPKELEEAGWEAYDDNLLRRSTSVTVQSLGGTFETSPGVFETRDAGGEVLSIAYVTDTDITIYGGGAYAGNTKEKTAYFSKADDEKNGSDWYKYYADYYKNATEQTAKLATKAPSSTPQPVSTGDVVNTWPQGLPVPDGWERVPGYDTLIRLVASVKEPETTLSDSEIGAIDTAVNGQIESIQAQIAELDAAINVLMGRDKDAASYSPNESQLNSIEGLRELYEKRAGLIQQFSAMNYYKTLAYMGYELKDDYFSWLSAYTSKEMAPFIKDDGSVDIFKAINSGKVSDNIIRSAANMSTVNYNAVKELAPFVNKDGGVDIIKAIKSGDVRDTSFIKVLGITQDKYNDFKMIAKYTDDTGNINVAAMYVDNISYETMHKLIGISESEYKNLTEGFTQLKESDPEGWRIYLTEGYESYQKYFNSNNTELPDGTWMPNKIISDIKESDPKGYEKLTTEGYEAYQTYFRDNNTMVGKNSEGVDIWIPNTVLKEIEAKDPEGWKEYQAGGWDKYQEYFKNNNTMVGKNSEGVDIWIPNTVLKEIEAKDPEGWKEYQAGGWDKYQEYFKDNNTEVSENVWIPNAVLKEIEAKDPEGWKEYQAGGWDKYQEYFKANNTEVSKGEWIPNVVLKDIEATDPDGWKIYQTEGWDAYQKYFNDTYTKLPDNRYFNTSELNAMNDPNSDSYNPSAYSLLTTAGYDAYITAINGVDRHMDEQNYKDENGDYYLQNAIGKISDADLVLLFGQKAVDKAKADIAADYQKQYNIIEMSLDPTGTWRQSNIDSSIRATPYDGKEEGGGTGFTFSSLFQYMNQTHIETAMREAGINLPTFVSSGELSKVWNNLDDDTKRIIVDKLKTDSDVINEWIGPTKELSVDDLTGLTTSSFYNPFNYASQERLRETMVSLGYIKPTSSFYTLKTTWDGLSEAERKRVLEEFNSTPTISNRIDDLSQTVAKWIDTNLSAPGKENYTGMGDNVTGNMLGLGQIAAGGLASAVSGLVIGVGGSIVKSVEAAGSGNIKQAGMDLAYIPIGMGEYAVDVGDRMLVNPIETSAEIVGMLSLPFVFESARAGGKVGLDTVKIAKAVVKGDITPARALTNVKYGLESLVVPEGFVILQDFSTLFKDPKFLEELAKKTPEEQLKLIETNLNGRSWQVFKAGYDVAKEIGEIKAPAGFLRTPEETFAAVESLQGLNNTQMASVLADFLRRHKEDIRVEGSVTEYIVKLVEDTPGDFDFTVVKGSKSTPEQLAKELYNEWRKVENKITYEGGAIKGTDKIAEFHEQGQFAKNEFGNAVFNLNQPSVYIGGIQFRPFGEQVLSRASSIFRPGTEMQAGQLFPEHTGRLKDIARWEKDMQVALEIMKATGDKKLAAAQKAVDNFIKVAPDGWLNKPKLTPDEEKNTVLIEGEYKADGTLIAGEPRVKTDVPKGLQTSDDFIKLVAKAQEECMKTGKPATIEGKLGSVTAYPNPLTKGLPGTVFHVSRISELNKLIESIKSNGKANVLEDRPMFFSRDAAFDYAIAKWKEMPSDVVVIALRTTPKDIGVGKNISPAWRAEGFYENGKLVSRVIDEVKMKAGTDLYATRTNGVDVLMGKSTGETKVFNPRKLWSETPVIWLATESAKKAGLGAPDRAMLRSIVKESIVDAVKDVAHPHAPVLSRKAEGPAIKFNIGDQFYKGSLKWRKVGDEPITVKIGQTASKISEEAIRLVNAEAGEIKLGNLLKPEEIIELKKLAADAGIKDAASLKALERNWDTISPAIKDMKSTDAAAYLQEWIKTNKNEYPVETFEAAAEKVTDKLIKDEIADIVKDKAAMDAVTKAAKDGSLKSLIEINVKEYLAESLKAGSTSGIIKDTSSKTSTAKTSKTSFTSASTATTAGTTKPIQGFAPLSTKLVASTERLSKFTGKTATSMTSKKATKKTSMTSTSAVSLNTSKTSKATETTSAKSTTGTSTITNKTATNTNTTRTTDTITTTPFTKHITRRLPPPILPTTSDSKKSTTLAKFDKEKIDKKKFGSKGEIAWRQGLWWITLWPKIGGGYMTEYSKEPPEGYHRRKRLPNETFFTRGSKNAIPSEIKMQMGIVDVNITPTGRIKLRYKRK